MVNIIRRWWWTLEEPPQWTSAMFVLYGLWAAMGGLLLRGIATLPGAEMWVTLLLASLLIVGGLLASPATLIGARWSERIGNVLLQLALAIGLVTFMATASNWPASWFWPVVVLFLTAGSLFALRLSHIAMTAYRPGSRSARGAAESRGVSAWGQKQHPG